jgi:hypothetical protein
MKTWLEVALGLLKLINLVLSSAQSTKDKASGRAEAYLEAIHASTELVSTGLAARAAARQRDATPDGLSVNDGLRRD